MKLMKLISCSASGKRASLGALVINFSHSSVRVKILNWHHCFIICVMYLISERWAHFETDEVNTPFSPSKEMASSRAYVNNFHHSHSRSCHQ